MAVTESAVAPVGRGPERARSGPEDERAHPRRDHDGAHVGQSGCRGMLGPQAARDSAAHTYARSLPVVAVRARGLTVKDADGRRYLDCLSGAGTLALGHNHPVVLEAPGGARDVRAALLPYPQDYRCPFGLGSERGAGLAARRTESVLDDTASGAPSPAGTILEPVQGEGRVLPTPDGWLRRMREITAARSIPLSFGETWTSAGRTGHFWAVEHSGVVPDVMVLPRAIGGSLPLADVVHRDDLDVWRPGAHIGTCHGNQLAMAAGAATLAHVRENGLAERAATLGARILAVLRPLTERLSCVGDVRGRGLMIGIEMVTPDALPASHDTGPSPSAPSLATAVQRECLRRGLIVDVSGRHAGVVRLLPPLTITDEQTSAVLDRLTDAIARVAATSTARFPPHPAPARDGGLPRMPGG